MNHFHILTPQHKRSRNWLNLSAKRIFSFCGIPQHVLGRCWLSRLVHTESLAFERTRRDSAPSYLCQSIESFELVALPLTSKSNVWLHSLKTAMEVSDAETPCKASRIVKCGRSRCYHSTVMRHDGMYAPPNFGGIVACPTNGPLSTALWRYCMYSTVVYCILARTFVEKVSTREGLHMCRLMRPDALANCNSPVHTESC